MILVTTKERLTQYIDFKGINVSEFLRLTDIKRGFLDSDKLKSSVSDLHIAKIIATCTDLNVEWLLTGNGNMLKDARSNNSDIVIEEVPSFRKTSDPIHEIQRVPLYSITATMGLIPSINDTEYLIDYISIPDLPKCDGAIHAIGDSMHPLLKAGDIVVYKNVDVDITRIFFGEVYILSIFLDSETTMKTIKYIHQSDKGDGYVKLVSANQYHADKDIALSSIAAMALVRAHIRIHN